MINVKVVTNCVSRIKEMINLMLIFVNLSESTGIIYKQCWYCEENNQFHTKKIMLHSNTSLSLPPIQSIYSSSAVFNPLKASAASSASPLSSALSSPANKLSISFWYFS